jgi:hypothetical protein
MEGRYALGKNHGKQSSQCHMSYSKIYVAVILRLAGQHVMPACVENAI